VVDAVKILLDCRFQKGAGANVTTEYLVARILDAGGENEYLILQHAHQSFGDAVDVRKIIVPTTHRLAEFLWIQFALPRILKLERVDVYHSLKHFGPLWTRGKTILMNRAVSQFLPGHQKLSFVDWFYWTVIGRMAWRRATRVIPLSSVCRDVLIERAGIDPEQILVIPHGIDPIFQPANEQKASKTWRAEHGLPEKYLLCVGNVYTHKNYDTVVRAFHALREEGVLDTRYKLVIAGSASDGSEILTRVIGELGCSDDVLLTGFIPHATLLAFYQGAELFLFPSRYEAFPNPVLEAMACGVPVVASAGGAIPEISGGAALLVESVTDPTAFADAIRSVVCDTSRRRGLVEAGLQRAAAFSWDATARRFLDLYAEVTATGP
jgi:glycosyltransferase involved in cell wall biosynthesis